MPSNKKRYSIAEAAKELGLTRQTVHAAILQKRLKAKRGTFEVERIVKTKMKGWTIVGILVCVTIAGGRLGFAQTPPSPRVFVDAAIMADRDPTDSFYGSDAGKAG